MPNITVICERCGLEITVDKSQWRTRYCKNCKIDVKRENARKAVKKCKDKKKIKPVKLPLEKVIALQDKYNREHGTFYTYGQFCSKLESGEIKIEE